MRGQSLRRMPVVSDGRAVGIVSLEPRTGKVRAMVGGRDFYGERQSSKVNSWVSEAHQPTLEYPGWTVKPAVPLGTELTGNASWYGPGFHGKTAASGERFDQNAMTAAHKSLPFGTVVRVTDQRTGKSVQVKINDRGPFHRNRIIDLSKAAAAKLGIQRAGTGKVCVDAV